MAQLVEKVEVDPGDYLPGRKKRRLAYYSSDILIHPAVHSGAGGLGVVAGSVFWELLEGYKIHKTSALFIGTYCSHGYHVQKVEDGIIKIHYEPDRNPAATIDTGVRFKLILDDRECWVAIRTPSGVLDKNVSMILLDTDIEENSHAPDFQRITRTLYGESHASWYFGHEMEDWEDIGWTRVLQAAVLGLGGFYAMQELGIECELEHFNDSHPVLRGVHMLGLLMEEGKTFDEALALVNKVVRFTNHTILESGNKAYKIRHIAKICSHYAGFDHETLQKLADHQTEFKMTNVALKLAGEGHANTVSKDHNRIASELFGYKFFPITNGIHIPTYLHPALENIEHWSEIPERKLLIAREGYRELKKHAADAGWIVENVHPRDWFNAVRIGWARRGQEYKRFGLIWHSKERPFVERLLDWREIAIAWGASIHPDDHEMIDEFNRYWHKEGIQHFPNVMPVINHRMNLMMKLKAWMHIWLNTPQYGYEACGTSWMNALLNFALVISILDGGTLESNFIVGFGSTTRGDAHSQHEYDAEQLWRTLWPYIIKIRENDPAVLEWLLNGHKEALEKWSATRMVTDYQTKLWIE